MFETGLRTFPSLAETLTSALIDGPTVHILFVSTESIISQIIGDELLEQLQPHRRVKRREKILPGQSVTDNITIMCCCFFKHLLFFSRLTDGCSSHMTAVAVGALGGYLNYYLAEQDITKRPLS